MVQIVEYEGTQHEFPDDFSQEDIAAALKTVETKPPESGVRDKVRQFGAGANRAIGKALSIAPIPLVAKEIFGEDTPTDLGGLFYRGLGAIDRDPTKITPRTPGERVAAGAGEMAAMTPMLGAGLTGAFGKAVEAMPTASQGLAGVFQNIGRQAAAPYISATPGRMVATDIVSGAGAGAAQQGYKELTPDEEETFGGETVAGIAGGIGAPLTLGTTGQAARWILEKPIFARGIEHITDKALSMLPGKWGETAHARVQEHGRKMAAPHVGKYIEGLDSDDVKAQMARGQELETEIPGYYETLGQATDLPTVQAIENRLKTTETDPVRTTAMRDLQRGNRTAIDKYAEAQRPGTDDAGAIVERQARLRVDSIKNRIDRGLADEQAKMQRVTDELPEASNFDSGHQLRTRMDELETAEREAMTARRDELDLSPGTLIKYGTIQNRINQFVRRNNMTPEQAQRQFSPEIKRIMAQDPAEFGNFGEIEADLKTLGPLIRSAARGTTGEGYNPSLLRGQRDALLDAIGDAMPQQAANYKQWRGEYVDRVIGRFEDGAALKVGNKGLAGEGNRLESEFVGGQFFKPDDKGGVTSMRQFARTFGNDEQARDILETIVLDRARNAPGVLKDGVVNPKALEKFAAAHRQSLDEAGLSPLLEDTRSFADAVTRRTSELRGRLEAVQNSKLARALGGDDSVTKMVDGVLRDSRLGREVARSLDDDGRMAMARLLWDRAVPAQGADAGDLRGFLTEHGNALSNFLEPGHIKALNNIADALERQARTVAPTARAPRVTGFEAVEQTLGVGPGQLLSRSFAAESGRSSPRWVLFNLLGHAGVVATQQQVDAAMRQAIFDKDMARELASYLTLPTKRDPRFLRNYMTAVGLTSAVPDESDKEPR